MIFEALSDFNARRRKIFSFSRAFALGGNAAAARRAASGLDDQDLKRLKDEADSARARKAIEGER